VRAARSRAVLGLEAADGAGHPWPPATAAGAWSQARSPGRTVALGLSRGSGCLILRETTAEGTERTVGFRFPGEVVGLEGWASGSQSFTAIATDATSVCRVTMTPAGAGYCSAALLEQLLVKCTFRLERSEKLWRGLPAVELVAAFLDDFAQRTHLSANVTDLRKLPMTRADIGSCLGLAEETVVRALTQLRSRRGAEIGGSRTATHA